jgi:hypothetical protein
VGGVLAVLRFSGVVLPVIADAVWQRLEVLVVGDPANSGVQALYRALRPATRTFPLPSSEPLPLVSGH